MVPDCIWLSVSALTELHASLNGPVPCMMPESSVMMTDIYMLCPVSCALCAVLLTPVPAATLVKGLWFRLSITLNCLWFRSIMPFRDMPLLLQSNELGASIASLLVPA